LVTAPFVFERRPYSFSLCVYFYRMTWSLSFLPVTTQLLMLWVQHSIILPRTRYINLWELCFFQVISSYLHLSLGGSTKTSSWGHWIFGWWTSWCYSYCWTIESNALSQHGYSRGKIFHSWAS
jgi:hypothetical protein